MRTNLVSKMTALENILVRLVLLDNYYLWVPAL